nr:MAG: ORF1a protein [Jingmen rodent astrovirus 2]
MAAFKRVYASRVDAAVNSGNYLARVMLGEQAIYSLRKVKEHLPDSPWSIHSAPRHLIYPSTHMDPKDRIITASSVTVDNEWVTYIWDGANWVQVATAPDDQAVILVCALINNNRELKEEVSSLKVKLANADAELSVLRAAYEKIRPPTQSRKLNWTVIIGFICLLLAMFFSASEALETQSTTFGRDPETMMRLNEELSRFIGKSKHQNLTRSITEYHIEALQTRVITYYTMVKEHIWERYNTIPVNDYRSAIFRTIGALIPWAWEIVAVALSVVSIATGKRTLTNILYLVASTLTRMRFVMIAIAPFQTGYTVFVALFLAANYVMDPLVSVAFSILHLVGFSIIGLFMNDVDYLQNLRAACTLTLAFTGYWVCEVCHIPTGIITFTLFIWRVWRLLSALPANTIEIRDETGRVTTKLAANPGYLFRFKQAFKQRFRNPFSQVRTVHTPLARVNPAALCHVSTKEGKGTGFFCANYIVTAGHVVGNNTCVRVCYFGKNYDTTVKKKGEKDYALLNIPQEISRSPRLKISKKHDCEWVCICAPDGDGAYLTAVTQGHDHGDTYSYVTPTRDGMSGAPLLDVDGHVLGVHQTNTGYTGGAIRLDLEDVTDAPKPDPKMVAAQQEIEELKKAIEVLKANHTEKQRPKEEPVKKADLEQCSSSNDIVGLVRAAMQREMQILREELQFGQKKKHKTKRGRGRKHNLRAGGKRKKQRGAMFTEEEYQEMLDNGLDPDSIRELAEKLYEEQAGFPEWSDPEYSDDDDYWDYGSENGRDTDEYDSDNYGGDTYGENDGYYQKMKVPLVKYMTKSYNKEDVNAMLQSLCPLEEKICSREIKHLKDAIKSGSEDKVSLCIAALDRKAAANGLATFSDDLGFVQRVKPKNAPRAQNTKGPKKGAQGSTPGKKN